MLTAIIVFWTLESFHIARGVLCMCEYALCGVNNMYCTM